MPDDRLMPEPGSARPPEEGTGSQALATGRPASDDDWFVQWQGKEVGPFRAEEMRADAAGGTLAPDDLVRKRGGEWAPAKDLPFLQAVFRRRGLAADLRRGAAAIPRSLGEVAGPDGIGNPLRWPFRRCARCRSLMTLVRVESMEYKSEIHLMVIPLGKRLYYSCAGCRKQIKVRSLWRNLLALPGCLLFLGFIAMIINTSDWAMGLFPALLSIFPLKLLSEILTRFNYPTVRRPDSFTAEQRQRLAELMAGWRAYRDAGAPFSPEAQAELDARLVRSELQAPAQRSAAQPGVSTLGTPPPPSNR
jgi:hypothetical protein